MKHERDSRLSAPTNYHVPFDVAQNVGDLDGRCPGGRKQQPVADRLGGPRNRCSIEHHVGHALTVLDTRSLVEHRSVEARIRENDVVSGRSPFSGDRQARLGTPVAVEFGVDKNDDAGE